MSISIPLVVLAFAGFAVYLGWRRIQRSKGGPILPSDKYVGRAAIVCLVVGCIVVILTR